jgi:hypothetical protein
MLIFIVVNYYFKNIFIETFCDSENNYNPKHDVAQVPVTSFDTGFPFGTEYDEIAPDLFLDGSLYIFFTTFKAFRAFSSLGHLLIYFDFYPKYLSYFS